MWELECHYAGEPGMRALLYGGARCKRSVTDALRTQVETHTLSVAGGGAAPRARTADGSAAANGTAAVFRAAHAAHPHRPEHVTCAPPPAVLYPTSLHLSTLYYRTRTLRAQCVQRLPQRFCVDCCTRVVSLAVRCRDLLPLVHHISPRSVWHCQECDNVIYIKSVVQVQQ